MTTTINASTSSGLVVTPDNSGNILLQYNGVAAPAFSVYASASSTYTSGAFNKIAYNTKTFDTNSNFDAVTNYRFTPTVAGYYQINAAVTLNGAAMSPAWIAIYKNGSEYKRGGFNPTTGTYGYAIAIPSVQDIIYFNGTTDYVEFYGYPGNATGQTGGANQTYASGCLLRGA